jgi:hypothetical protein
VTEQAIGGAAAAATGVGRVRSVAQVTTREPAAKAGPPPRRWYARPVVAALVLLAVYVALSFLNSPRGYLGTDTGGKVATLKVMDERGDFVPDVGYWAARWDPKGQLHGLYYTSKIGNHYVNVTSLPMVLAAEPLYRLGGYRLALLWPMAGSIAAAFAARALARRVSSGDGWAAYWVVGLASPLTIYALDFWEHSLGVALMAWGVVALYDAVEVRPTWWRGALAGVAFGAALSMRTEAAVYALTSVAIACLVIWLVRHRFGAAVVVGASAVVGLGGLFLANAALEVAVLGDSIRSGRVSGAAGGGGSDLVLRAKEGLVTSLSPFPAVDASAFLLGGVLGAALLYLVWSSASRRDRALTAIAAGIVGFIYLDRLADGIGFVPGLIATTPLAAAAVVLGWRRPASRLVVAMAVVPLPLVFLFEFSGGAAPQWGGRYILTSGTLLLAVGVATWDALERWVRNLLLGLSIAVTVFGVGWLSVRSHQVARAADRLESRPEPVLISPDGFIPREFGGSYGRKDWLATGSASDLRRAVQVVRDAGRSEFALVSLDTSGRPPTFAGFQAGRSTLVPFITDTKLRVTHYQRDGS